MFLYVHAATFTCTVCIADNSTVIIIRSFTDAMGLDRGNWARRSEWEALRGEVSRRWPDSVVQMIFFGYFHMEADSSVNQLRGRRAEGKRLHLVYAYV